MALLQVLFFIIEIMLFYVITEVNERFFGQQQQNCPWYLRLGTHIHKYTLIHKQTLFPPQFWDGQTAELVRVLQCFQLVLAKRAPSNINETYLRYKCKVQIL